MYYGHNTCTRAADFFQLKGFFFQLEIATEKKNSRALARVFFSVGFFFQVDQRFFSQLERFFFQLRVFFPVEEVFFPVEGFFFSWSIAGSQYAWSCARQVGGPAAVSTPGGREIQLEARGAGVMPI